MEAVKLCGFCGRCVACLRKAGKKVLGGTNEKQEPAYICEDCIHKLRAKLQEDSSYVREVKEETGE